MLPLWRTRACAKPLVGDGLALEKMDKLGSIFASE